MIARVTSSRFDYRVRRALRMLPPLVVLRGLTQSMAAQLAFGGAVGGTVAYCCMASSGWLHEPEPELEPEPEQPEPELGVVAGWKTSWLHDPDDPLPALYCTIPPGLREECIHRYDTARFPFAQLLAAVVAPALPGDAAAGAEEGLSPSTVLQRIHRRPDVVEWLRGMRLNKARPYAVRRNLIDKRLKAARPFAPEAALGRCYLRFLREVVMPAVHRALRACGDDSDAGILYQREPNFRCHLPETGHLLVHKHRDADYHHQQNEINFWLPCTPAYGSNTCWSESAPGVGDFRPFELDFGEMVQFWGNQCLHYTLPNDTPHSRLTIDFRVIPLQHYMESYPNSHSQKTGQPRFGKDAYFAVMTPETAVLSLPAQPLSACSTSLPAANVPEGDIAGESSQTTHDLENQTPDAQFAAGEARERQGDRKMRYQANLVRTRT